MNTQEVNLNVEEHTSETVDKLITIALARAMLGMKHSTFYRTLRQRMKD